MRTTDTSQALIWSHVNAIHIRQATGHNPPKPINEAIDNLIDIFKAHGFKTKPEQKKKKSKPKK